MSEDKPKQPAFPAQVQEQQPGIEAIMRPRPVFDSADYRPADKLKNKVAVISGGDSGIGRAVALAFAKEGADVAIIYLNENQDAQETQTWVKRLGRKCLLLPGDVGEESFCRRAAEQVRTCFNKVDILVNNAAEQHCQNSILDISAEQLQRTFRTNVFGYFYLTKAVLPYLPAGGCIINTASITAYKGHDRLIDYSASKGAVVSFTRSMSESLCKQGIRVNAVAPGPVWTPLIPASFPAEDVVAFGTDTPMGRAGQPVELAGAYVFLASQDAAFMSGAVLHINGGTVINC